MAARISRRPPRFCFCGAPHRAGGYCEKHYRRFLKYGDPLGGPGRGKGPRPNRRKNATPE